MEKYPSGRRGSPAKGVGGLKRARGQIPASPHETSGYLLCRMFGGFPISGNWDQGKRCVHLTPAASESHGIQETFHAIL